jgi:hypothetical protein
MSDDSLGFEPIDDELRRRLGAAGPRPGDPDVTLGALRPRYRRAKRRHRAVLAAGSLVAVVAILGVGTAVFSADGSSPSNVRIPAANSSAPSGETTTSSVPGPAPTTPPQPTTPKGTSGPDNGATSGDAVTATSVAPAAPTTQTFSSDGGTVTVKLERGALSIVASQAAAGYSKELHDTGPDRVEVRFTNDEGEWRIRVDLVNGALVPEISEH